MGTLTKQLIGKEDFDVQVNTNLPEQFSRLTSTGGTIDLYKVPDMWTYTGVLRPYDVFTKGSVANVCAFMDGQSARPTYETWYANQTITDVTAAIQAAIDSITTYGIVWFPKGTYKITSTLNITTGVVLQGVGMYGSMIWLAHATTDGIYVYNASGITGFGMKDIGVICHLSEARTAGKAVHIKTVGNWALENVAIRNGWDGLYLSNASTGVVKNLVIDEIYAGTSNNGITITDNCISNKFYGAAITANNFGVQVDSGTDTLLLDGVEVGTVAKCDWGFYFHNNGIYHDPRWIRMKNCFAEATKGYGIYKGYDIEFDGCYSAYGTNGIHINNATSTGIKIKGGIYQLAQNEGILIDDVGSLFIGDGCMVSDNNESGGSYPGINVAAGISNFQVIGTKSGNKIWNGAGGLGGQQDYGMIVQVGASNNYIVSLNDFNNNATGGLSDGGTGATKVVTNNIP